MSRLLLRRPNKNRSVWIDVNNKGSPDGAKVTIAYIRATIFHSCLRAFMQQRGAECVAHAVHILRSTGLYL